MEGNKIEESRRMDGKKVWEERKELEERKKAEEREENEMGIEERERKMDGEEENAEEEVLFQDYEELLQDLEKDIPDYEKAAKEIEKRINRRIASVALRVVLPVLAAIALLTVGIHFLLSIGYSYPVSKQWKHTKQEGRSDLAVYMDTYASVYMPYVTVYNTAVKNRGFGNYTLKMDVYDLTGSINLVVGSEDDMSDTFYIDRGEIVSGASSNGFRHMMGRFSGLATNTAEEILPELEELPKSAIIYCSLRLGEALLPEELEAPGINLMWLCADQDVNKMEAGINVHKVFFWEEEAFDEELTGKNVKEAFLHRADLLLEDPKLLAFWGGGGSVIYSDVGGELRRVRDAVAAQEEFKSRKICLSGKKEDVIAYIKKMQPVSIFIDHVRTSKWAG